MGGGTPVAVTLIRGVVKRRVVDQSAGAGLVINRLVVQWIRDQDMGSGVYGG